MTSLSSRFGRATGLGVAAWLGLALVTHAHAHGISESSRAAMAEGGLLAYVWLGAEHMVTGYDHLLFLFGVIFFLKSFRDIVRFITAFTLGHCITLLGATVLGITANPWLIDAVIALSVLYKGFENLDGFERYLKVKVPGLLGMVFVFGLIHGFGLSTRLQELPLGDEGLVTRILAFNVGVELGQVAALTVMLGFFALWRSSAAFARFDRAANVLLCVAGGGLFVYQLAGFGGLIADEHGDDHGDEHGHHGEEDAHHHGEHGHGGHDHGGHAHEQTVGSVAPEAGTGGHDHGHGHEQGSEAPAAPEAESGGHDHGHGHGQDAAAPAAPAAPEAASGGHDHGHGHGSHSP